MLDGSFNQTEEGNILLLQSHKLQRLLFWNRVWAATCVLLVLLAALLWGTNHLRQLLLEVHSQWSTDTLLVSTITGRVVITHLEGESANTRVMAQLPTPRFIVDSESVKFDKQTLQGLEWRDEGGGTHPAPASGSPILALYYRTQPSTWRGE